MDKMIIGKVKIPLKEKEFVDCNIIKCAAGTTGWQKEGSKWDCKTYVEFSNEACTVMTARVEEDSDGYARRIGILLEGETELFTFIEALEFAARTLREMGSIPDIGTDSEVNPLL